MQKLLVILKSPIRHRCCYGFVFVHGTFRIAQLPDADNERREKDKSRRIDKSNTGDAELTTDETKTDKRRNVDSTDYSVDEALSQTPVLSCPGIVEKHLEQMAKLIYCSNAIENVGGSWKTTKRFCKTVFAGHISFTSTSMTSIIIMKSACLRLLSEEQINYRLLGPEGNSYNMLSL
jgi:hypothetical protein